MTKVLALVIVVAMTLATPVEAKAEYTREQLLRFEKQLETIKIHALVTTFGRSKGGTLAWIQPYVRYDTSLDRLGGVTSYGWRKDGSYFVAVIDQPRLLAPKRRLQTIQTLFRIGQTTESPPQPLFTTNKLKALRWLVDQRSSRSSNADLPRACLAVREIGR